MEALLNTSTECEARKTREQMAYGLLQASLRVLQQLEVVLEIAVNVAQCCTKQQGHKSRWVRAKKA
jgi:hypothetical protein